MVIIWMFQYFAAKIKNYVDFANEKRAKRNED